MMSFEKFGIKVYSDATKYRAVLWQYFDPQVRAQAERKNYIEMGASPQQAVEDFPDPPLPTPDAELVVEAVKWVFKHDRDIKPGRFNDASFPTLYTAKEPQTARDELAHWSSITYERLSHEYVIFCVLFTGTAVDIRPPQDRGEYDMPLSHEECQPLGARVRQEADSIAYYSKRRDNGNCCAIFKEDTVKPLSIFQRAFL